MKSLKCQRCNGTGAEPDQVETGRRMRALREAKGIALREAAIGIGISESYLSDMEHGKRAWVTTRIQQMERLLSK